MHSIYLLAILETTNCLSLRNNAACCIPLRYQRYLRENTLKSTQSICTNETPMSPADPADLRRRNPKQHEPHQPIFLCEINTALLYISASSALSARE